MNGCLAFLSILERRIILALALGMAVSVAPPSKAADIFWNNSAGGDWNVAANWSPNQVPGANDTAIINLPGSYVVSLGGNFSIGSVVNGSAQASPTLRLYNTTLEVGGVITNWGTIELTSSNAPASTVLNMGGRPLVNQGTLAVLEGAGGPRSLNAGLDNAGTLRVETQFVIATGAGQLNRGTVTLAGGDLTFVSGTWTNRGPIQLNGRSFTVSSAVFELESGGIVGPGTLSFSGILNLKTELSNTNLLLFLNNTTVNGPGRLLNAAGQVLSLLRCTINATMENRGLLLAAAPNGLNGGLSNLIGATIRLYSGGGPFDTGLAVAGGFTNAGTIELTSSNAPGTTVLEVNGGAFVNLGTLASLAGAGGQRNLNATLDNAGTIQLETGLIVGNGTAHRNQGLITIATGQTLVVSGVSFTNAPIGLITGSGTLNVSSISFANSGAVAPGAPTGVLNVTGNFPQTASGALNIGIAGRAIGSFDQLNIGGGATLDGTLNVSFVNGFVPVVGDRFQILSFAARDGSFETVAGEGTTFDLQYNSTNVVLIVRAPPPEPRLITGVTATATSELAAAPFGRYASNAVNGVKFDSFFWESVGVNQGFGEDRDPAITFDLTQVYSLDHLLIWNSHEFESGIKRMLILVSLDGQLFSSVGEFSLSAGAPNQSQQLALGGVRARYVRFDILENWAGQIFPVIGNPTAWSLVAIDEVEFYSAGPPPAESPSITAQSQSQSVTLSNAVALSVTASGTPPLSYQWRHNGANIPGATNATYNIAAFDLPDAGNYTVAVANQFGAVESAVIRLFPLLPSVPVTNNFAARVTITNAALVGEANNRGANKEPGEPNHAGNPGDKSVWFTWRPSVSGIGMVSLAGSAFDTALAVYQGSILTNLTLVAQDDDGGGFFTSQATFNVVADQSYEVAIDGFGGAEGDIVLKLSVEVTADSVPEITLQPTGQTVAPGAVVALSVTARAGGSAAGLNYQWFQDGVPIGAATNSTYTIPSVQSTNVGTYTVRITQGTRSVLSQPAVVQISVTDTGGAQTAVAIVDKFAQAALAALQTNAVSVGPPPVRPPPVSGFTGTRTFRTVGATKEQGEPNHCDIVGGASQWFFYQPPMDGMLVMNTEGSSFDTVLAAYTNAGPVIDLTNLISVACDNDSGSNGKTSAMTFQVAKDTLYSIAIDGVNAATGTVQLNYRLVVLLQFTSWAYTGNQFQLQFTGQPGGNFVVQASATLTNWATVFTTNSASGSVSFTDTNLFGLDRRCYRVFQP
jgi:hypothetical protein